MHHVRLPLPMTGVVGRVLPALPKDVEDFVRGEQHGEASPTASAAAETLNHTRPILKIPHTFPTPPLLCSQSFRDSQAHSPDVL